MNAESRCPLNRLTTEFKSYFGCDLDRLLDDSQWTVLSRCDSQIQASVLRPPGKEARSSAQPIGVQALSALLDGVESLRYERYVSKHNRERLARRMYYALRPLLGRHIRQLLHRRVFQQRAKSDFPSWPLDCTVERSFKALMHRVLLASEGAEIPFIWFWPNGQSAALMMTHDVEGKVGAARCGALMDRNESFGIRAAFQLVPEGSYDGIRELAAAIRARGHEVNVHDLDHDGRLYNSADLFAQRAERIRKYAESYEAKGFRAGSMHRNQDWLALLHIEYDMSIPNIAHMEPQSGGCCTVMPYFIGDVLELPLTTIQDYGLMHILKQESIDIWIKQIEEICSYHGLVSFIVHPDYLSEPHECKMYSDLLQHITRKKRECDLWIALPGEINTWWRQRNNMELIRTSDGWRIQGEGCERARVAFARIVDNDIVYSFESQSVAAMASQQLLV